MVSGERYVTKRPGHYPKRPSFVSRLVCPIAGGQQIECVEGKVCESRQGSGGCFEGSQLNSFLRFSALVFLLSLVLFLTYNIIRHCQPSLFLAGEICGLPEHKNSEAKNVSED